MSYLYTGTTQGAGTNTGLSTQILVQVDGQAVGAIQSLSSNQSRAIKRIVEVGTDGTIELVPEKATETSLSVTRIIFDKKRLTESFQRGFLNIHAQRVPFDIFVYDFTSAIADPSDPTSVNPNELDVSSSFDAGLTAEGVVTTIYENCWFTSLKTTFSADSYIISEDADIDVEFVHSFRDGNTQLSASRGNPDFKDALERVADVGRRGTLDARGLGGVADIFSRFQPPTTR